MPISSLSQLTPDPHNRRAHTPRNLEMLRAALAKVGAARSIVIDEDGGILAGNGLVAAASSMGLDKVKAG
jgi:ParB-like chromosome segregation protein Spo0J